MRAQLFANDLARQVHAARLAQRQQQRRTIMFGAGAPAETHQPDAVADRHIPRRC
jgi:hypothetical protein